MGCSISWVAARQTCDALMKALDLEGSGQEEETFGAPIAGRQLESGWYLIVANRCDHALISDSILARLSAQTDVVACSIEEHVMVCRAEYWAGGTKRWSIAHDAQVGTAHLEVVGDPPAPFTEVRDGLLAKQAAEDLAGPLVDFVFDVPLEMARRMTGFKHDEDDEASRWTNFSAATGSPLAARDRWWKFW